MEKFDPTASRGGSAPVDSGKTTVTTAEPTVVVRVGTTPVAAVVTAFWPTLMV